MAPCIVMVVIPSPSSMAGHNFIYPPSMHIKPRSVVRRTAFLDQIPAIVIKILGWVGSHIVVRFGTNPALHAAPEWVISKPDEKGLKIIEMGRTEYCHWLVKRVRSEEKTSEL